MSEAMEIRARVARELSRRKEKNARYSQRAFARQLGIGRTVLSDWLNGKRGLSRRSAARVAERLQLSAADKTALLASCKPRPRAPEIPRRFLEQELYSLIADWEHYAILNLAETRENEASAERIASRLGLPAARVRRALRRLERLGFLRLEEGKLVRTTASFTTVTDVSSSALRKFQKQNLELARRSLERDALDLRDLTSITLAIDPKMLPVAKRLCRDFRRRMARAMEGGTPSEVYTLALQFFPVTRSRR